MAFLNMLGLLRYVKCLHMLHEYSEQPYVLQCSFHLSTEKLYCSSYFFWYIIWIFNILRVRLENWLILLFGSHHSLVQNRKWLSKLAQLHGLTWAIQMQASQLLSRYIFSLIISVLDMSYLFGPYL